MTKMIKQPTEITVVYVEAVLIPNGEIISCGKSLGWFREISHAVHDKKYFYQPKPEDQ